MKSITIRLDDPLFDWLTEQAAINHRSKNKQIEHLLDMARRTPINNHYPLADEKWATAPKKAETRP